MDYLNLAIGARKRLQYLKGYADGHNLKHGKNYSTGLPMTWKEARYSGFHNAHVMRCELSQGLNDGKPIWYCHTGQYFPRERWADEILKLDHTGWFCDDHQDEITRGLVVSLPHGRFLAGYWLSCNDERVYYPEVYTDIDQAARDADHYAQRYAEREREYQTKCEMAYRLQDQIDESLARIRECLVLRNNPCFNYARDEILELTQKIREMRDELTRDYADVL